MIAIDLITMDAMGASWITHFLLLCLVVDFTRKKTTLILRRKALAITKR